jgi:ketosteroid isomerase-like protein
VVNDEQFSRERFVADIADVFRLIIDRGFNQGDLSVADEVCARDFAEHQYLLPTDLPGPEILKIEIESARREVQGLRLTIEDLVVDGNKVWARMIAKGTDPRSGKPITMNVMDVCRFENGRMVEHWGIPDRFALLHQLGLLPKPPG